MVVGNWLAVSFADKNAPWLKHDRERDTKSGGKQEEDGRAKKEEGAQRVINAEN